MHIKKTKEISYKGSAAQQNGYHFGKAYLVDLSFLLDPGLPNLG
jgi:hypothetical protein